MEVKFTPEQEAELSQIAARNGTVTEQLVKNAALHLLDEEAHHRRELQIGIDQADRGEFVEHAEVWARIEKILNS